MDTNRKYKVLIVHNYYQNPGGEDTVVANEKKLLEDNGHEVILYSRHNNELKTMGIIHKILLPFTVIYNLRTIKEIKQIIKNNNIDIIHVHNTLSLISPSVYYIARKCGVPVIQTIHNYRFLCPGATLYRDGHICEDCIKKGLGCAVKHGCYRGSKIQTLLCVISSLLHRATGIYRGIYFIALTDFSRKKILELKQIDPEKVFVKPNFTYETFGYAKNKHEDYYLFIGRIEEIKGVKLLLEAFRQMPEKTIKFAGSGPLYEEVKRTATKNVIFCGQLNRQQLAIQLSSAKAVIVPSQCYETFGMSIIESYAAHKPVVVGDIGNIASLVENGNTGIKFLYNSPEALIAALEKVEDSMGENGYQKYINEFSPEANYKQLITIYDTVHGVFN